MELLLEWAKGRSLPEWLIFTAILIYIFREQIRAGFSKVFGLVEKKEAAVLAERQDQREHTQKAELEKLEATLKQQSWFDEQLMEMLSRYQAKLQDDYAADLEQIKSELKEQKYRLTRNNDLLTTLNMLLAEQTDLLRRLTGVETGVKHRSRSPTGATTQAMRHPVGKEKGESQ